MLKIFKPNDWQIVKLEGCEKENTLLILKYSPSRNRYKIDVSGYTDCNYNCI